MSNNTGSVPKAVYNDIGLYLLRDVATDIKVVHVFTCSASTMRSRATTSTVILRERRQTLVSAWHSIHVRSHFPLYRHCHENLLLYTIFRELSL